MPRTARLARLIRCAIVASGTRWARAISAVVRPPTARRVSAIWAAGESAGWQHRTSRVSVSSSEGARSGPPGAASGGGVTKASAGVSAAAVFSRLRRASSLRSRSVSRREATRISQPRGLSGIPSRGHCPAAAIRASWTASSAGSK
ncbi:hypothetical protein SCALM49S_08537 [Streptomyces californicus]